MQNEHSNQSNISHEPWLPILNLIYPGGKLLPIVYDQYLTEVKTYRTFFGKTIKSMLYRM